MAAGSTDTFNNNVTGDISGTITPVFNNYPVVSVTTGTNNFWPSEVTSTSTSSPSSDHNLDADEEETIKRRIYELKRQFHNGRFLIVKHLPRDATEEDVRELLTGHLVHSVQIHPTNNSARVLLAEPEVLENWPRTSQHSLRGAKIVITPSNTEGLLAVAKLPTDYTEDEFGALVSALGVINYSFLMRSEKTGESKGYGFVEYANKEIAMQAKAGLDGRELREAILVCEWLEPSHVTYASLHSTCLYVDRLPKDYRDMGEFRTIFSKVTSPPYCQIAMRQGVLQDWGLVEFTDPDGAEETRNLLNSHKLKGQPIRVEFCVPGARAIHIYMKLLNDMNHKKRGALLPEPPTNKVFTQLRNLTKHNPSFAKSLQNIILTQIQNLQQKGDGPQPPGVLHDAISDPTLVKLRGGCTNLLRPPPTLPLPPHFQFPPPIQHPLPPPLPQLPPPLPPPPTTSVAGIEQPLNSNAQAALVILLAAQLQQQQEQLQQTPQNGINGVACSSSSILSNPQVLKLLQNLVSQGDPLQQKQTRNDLSLLSSAGVFNAGSNNLSSSLKANFRNGYFKNGNKLLKGPLLPTPAKNSSVTWNQEEAQEQEVAVGGVPPILTGILTPQKESQQDDMDSSISKLLSNAQDLQQLLGSLNSDLHPPLSVTLPPTSTAMTGLPPQVPPPHVPTSFAGHSQPTLIAPHPSSMYHSTPPPDPVMSLLLRAADTGRPETFFAPLEATPHPVSAAPYLIASRGSIIPPATTWPQIGPPPPSAAAMFPPSPAVFQPTMAPRIYSPIYLTPTRTAGTSQAPMIGAPPPNPSVIGYSTPVGQKRKSSHFLPSPEASPENGYIGQHSQGIGGHYQDSYYNNKKKKKH